MRTTAIRREGGDACRVALFIFTVLLWISGFVLIIIGIWMLADPKRSYILELVDFSEDDPLLTFAAWISILAGILTLFVGFVACCGAMKRMRCMLTTLIGSMFVLFMCGVGIGTLALVYRDKFPTDERMTRYIKNMTHNRYSRDHWVLPLLDTIQFYAHGPTVTNALRFMMRHEYGVLQHLKRNERLTQLIDRMQFNLHCCGVTSHKDWKTTDWAADGTVEDETPLPLWRENPHEFVPVPDTCCRQLEGATALNPSPRSVARCQYKNASRQWRHQLQHCCGGEGPRDYEMSFWYITNTARGTITYTPYSCCKQTLAARAWSIHPVEPLCNLYPYGSKSSIDTVNQDGCGPKLHQWFSEQTSIFAGIGFGFATLQVIGMIIALCMCNQVRYYHYIKSEVY